MKMYSLNNIYKTKNAPLTICTLANIKYVKININYRGLVRFSPQQKSKMI